MGMLTTTRGKLKQWALFFSRNAQRCFENIGEIVKHLSSQVSSDFADMFMLEVQRSNALDSAMCGIDRKAFSPNNPLEVCSNYCELRHGTK